MEMPGSMGFRHQHPGEFFTILVVDQSILQDTGGMQNPSQRKIFPAKTVHQRRDLFGLPHILSDDGNIGAMGWDIAKFMPLKGRTPLPVPTEISLLITHICAILGSAQVSLIIMLLVRTRAPFY